MEPAQAGKRRRRAVWLSVTCLGLSAVVTQMVTLREFLNLFAGNELTIGLVLATWLLLTGLGGLFGRYARRARDPIGWVALAQMGIGLLPASQITGIRMLKQLLAPGSMLGLGAAFWAALAVLLPFCMLSGFLLAAFSGLAAARRDWRQIGAVYVLDTVGGIAGGLVFGLCLVHFFAPFQIATLLAILNLAAAASLAHAAERWGLRASIVGMLVVSLALLGLGDLERRTGQAMFPGLDVIEQRSTPYGNLVVVRQISQRTVYENGVPVGATGDSVAAEEIVHYALAQHPDPRRVLLISGGLMGAPHEVEKYSVERIDYVELDPAVLGLAERLAGTGTDSRMHAIAADARRHVRATRQAYDAILTALPDPSSAQVNRFYTVEFFAEVQRALRPGGVFSLSLSGAENYGTPEMRLLSSGVYRSLAAVFPNVLVIPGARQYFVASERPLGYDIAAQLERRGIATRYVRREYLAAKLSEDRLVAARRFVSGPGSFNRDFHPTSYYVHLRYWLSQFGSDILLPLLFVGVLLVLSAGLLAASPLPEMPAALCASGFAGMGLEVVLLIAFQVTYGYVYQQIGLIITGFMVGAAAGAAWSGRRRVDPWGLIFTSDASLAAVAFLAIPILLLLQATDHALLEECAPPVIFPLLNGVVGFLVGAQFPPAARLLFRTVEETAGQLYAFDLMGACLGALVVSAFCVPVMGIDTTCALLGGLKIASAAALLLRRRTLVLGPVPLPTRSPSAVVAFAFALLVVSAMGIAIAAEQTSGAVYALSFLPAYSWALVALLAVGIASAAGVGGKVSRPLRIGAQARKFAQKVRESTKMSVLRWVYFLGFSLAVFYPIFRCYFRVPYLFCHVCPRKCIFGLLRPYLVPAVLIMNLEKRFWCHRACPIGTLYDCQARLCRQSRRAPAWLRSIAYSALAFTAVAYFKVMWDLGHQPAVAFDWYTFFYSNQFAVSGAVIAAAAVLIVIAYRLRRSFCELLCPIGSSSDLLLRLGRFLAPRATAPHPSAEPRA